MSTDAWIEEHWIGEAVLPRPRRAPKLPALPVPHVPTCSRGNAALAAHAQSRDSARHPGDGLSTRQDGRNVVDQAARKLTQPHREGCRLTGAVRADQPVDLARSDREAHVTKDLRAAAPCLDRTKSNQDFAPSAPKGCHGSFGHTPILFL